MTDNFPLLAVRDTLAAASEQAKLEWEKAVEAGDLFAAARAEADFYRITNALGEAEGRLRAQSR